MKQIAVRALLRNSGGRGCHGCTVRRLHDRHPLDIPRGALEHTRHLHPEPGADFARATGKILILSSSNIIVYAITAGATFTQHGTVARLPSGLPGLACVYLAPESARSQNQVMPGNARLLCSNRRLNSRYS